MTMGYDDETPEDPEEVLVPLGEQLDVLDRERQQLERKARKAVATVAATKRGDDSKIAGRVIKIGARVELPALIRAQVDFVFANSKPVKGSSSIPPTAASANACSSATVTARCRSTGRNSRAAPSRPA